MNVATAPRAAPVATAAAAGVAAVYVAASDDRTWLPGCVFHSLTGLWCPGCGLTRAARAAMHGDIGGALSHNLLAPAFALALLVAWTQWWQRSRGRSRPTWLSGLTPWTTRIAVTALVVFGVARNLPIRPFTALAP